MSCSFGVLVCGWELFTVLFGSWLWVGGGNDLAYINVAYNIHVD